MADAPPLILAFDTAAAHCAAALVQGEAVLARRDEPMNRGQAERLLPMLEAMLAEAGVRWDALDGLAVGTGPGNFTGLRIGVAAARGLAMALGVPAVGVTTFEALADRPGPALVTLEDRRGSFFAQRFQDGAALAPPAAVDLPEATPEAARADPVALARVAARRLHAAPRPAPLYLRPADAMPSGPAPALLDDA